MTKAIVIESFGGPEVLKTKDVKLPPLRNGEVLVRQKVLGLNFLDIQNRKGMTVVDLPCTLGSEACGVIEDLEGDITEFSIGDRVAYISPIGAYTEARVINRDYLVPVPDYITDEQAASMLLKGMTAHYLLRRTFFANQKNTILVHGAAGGVGQLLCMLGKHYGSKVIATVNSEEKKKIVEAINIDLVVNMENDDLLEAVQSFTYGNGVHVVYDSIGRDTFDQSLEVLGDFGLMVNYGNVSGNPEPLDIARLTPKSLFITSPSLFTYKQHRAELLLSSNEVFALASKGVIRPSIFKRYKFSEIQDAHRNMESGKSTGQSVIVV